MGLAAALELCRKGARVDLLERDDRLGGMSAQFDFAGTRIERYYHFICTPDHTTFKYLREFGLEDKLRWTETRMGFYWNGKLHDWGTPQAMLAFPGLSFLQKLRYGLHVMRAKGITDWRPYDKLTSTQWVQKWIGKPAYDVMWRSLFRYKFYEHEDSLSAAWLGTRIKRVALSRKSIFQERLGYLDGGSEVLLDAVARELVRLGGKIQLACSVDAVVTDGGDVRRVRGIRMGGEERAYDAVVSTVPLPHVPALVPDLPPAEKAKIDAVRNVGVVCVILKLKRSFTPNFWLNINDPRLQIPGLIEYTNLNPLDDGSAIVYAPFYMPQGHPKYGRSNQAFIDETLDCLCTIRPDFDRTDVIAASASRYQYAQTVCTPGFYDALPPMRSSLPGFFMADTSYYYPEDRSISESLRIGVELANAVWSAR